MVSRHSQVCSAYIKPGHNLPHRVLQRRRLGSRLPFHKYKANIVLIIRINTRTEPEATKNDLTRTPCVHRATQPLLVQNARKPLLLDVVNAPRKKKPEFLHGSSKLWLIVKTEPNGKALE